MDRVDVVIVGGGVAGLATAAHLAGDGVGVRVYARGRFEGRPGGGIASGLDLEALGGPSVPMEVPFDRVVSDRRWLLLSADGDTTFDFLDTPPMMSQEELRTVRSATLAPWLAKRASTLGADLRPATTVEALRRGERGRVAGVRVGGEEIEALVTVLADGGALPANPSARRRPPTIEVAETFWELPARTVSARFGGRPGGGIVLEALLGPLSVERPAGGYVIPYRSGVAVGVVTAIASPPLPAASVLLERFEAHPSIAPFLRDGRRGPVAPLALSDRPEVGRPLSGPGFLAVGRAGGLEAATATRYLSVHAGLRSAAVAAAVARSAVAAKDPSALQLGSYAYGLAADGLLGELTKARQSGHRYRAAPGVARDIPRFANALFRELMVESGGPKRRIFPTLRAARRREKLSRRTLLRAAMIAGRWR